MLEEQHGIVVLVGGEQRVEGVLRRAGIQGLEPGHREEEGLELLRMERAEGQPAATREAEHERAGGAGPEVVGGGVERDLGDGLGGEVRELEFLDGPVAGDGEADGVAGAGALGERGIEDARAAEVLKQAVGDLERAAVGADVLAEENGFGALREDFPQAGIDGLGEIEGGGCAGRGFPGQWGRRRGKQAVRHAVGREFGRGERDLDAGLDEGRDLGVDGRQLDAVAGGGEAGAERRQRVAGGITLGFAGPHVVAGVVGGVAAEAHGVGLDQHGARRGADPGDGGGEGAGARLDIGGIEREALHTVAGGAAPELGAGGELFADRRGVGVAVVLEDENDRQ